MEDYKKYGFSSQKKLEEYKAWLKKTEKHGDSHMTDEQYDRMLRCECIACGTPLKMTKSEDGVCTGTHENCKNPKECGAKIEEIFSEKRG